MSKRGVIKNLLYYTKEPKVREFLLSQLSNKKQSSGTNYVKKKAESLRLDLIKKSKEEEYVLKAYLKSFDIKYKFKEPLYYDTENGKKFCIVDFYLPEINSIILVEEFTGENKLEYISKDRNIYRFYKKDFEDTNYINSRLRMIQSEVLKTFKGKLAV
jgi:hypothetical protein